MFGKLTTVLALVWTMFCSSGGKEAACLIVMLQAGPMAQGALFQQKHLLVAFSLLSHLFSVEQVAEAVTEEGCWVAFVYFAGCESRLICLGPALCFNVLFQSIFWGERKCQVGLVDAHKSAF